MEQAMDNQVPGYVGLAKKLGYIVRINRNEELTTYTMAPSHGHLFT